jgi:hypothetical protein
MPSKEGWTHECDHEKITLGRKQYRNMEEWTRPCGVCGNPFSIFVRTNATAINSSFGLKTCKEHRGQKLGTAGTAVFEQHEELERLREWEEVFHRALRLVQKKLGPHATMSKMDEHIALLIEAADEVFTEATRMRAELAKYELQPAMVEAQKVTAMNGALPNKMPWE